MKKELKRIRSLISAVTGLEDDDDEYLSDAIKAIDALVAKPAPEQTAQQEPLFWYKPYPNGMYNGPIHNAQIGDVLRGSEQWIPLYTRHQAHEPLTMIEMVDAAMVATRNIYPPITRSQCETIIRAAAHGIGEKPDAA